MFLVSGSAGFIGYHLCNALLKKNFKVVGVDNYDSYYDIKLKKKRCSILKKYKNFIFYKRDIRNKNQISKIFKLNKITCVIHLAAQAGVRYSLKNPKKYITTNINGFFNLIDLSKEFKIDQFIYASTSSIYGNIKKYPLSENLSANHPSQIYAATKKANEAIAHSYSSLYNLPTTGLRFFTVYGPWGRPDMALAKFVGNILRGKKIEVYNYGNHFRDFTYIDDVIKILLKVINRKAKKNLSWFASNPDNKTSYCPYKIINVGGNNSIKLMKFINYIEKALNLKAKIKFLPLQKGDVLKTQADPKWCLKQTGLKPNVSPKIGITSYVKWYKEYYKKN